MPVDLELHIRVEAYDVACRACGWQSRLHTRHVEQLDAHHQPVLLAIYSRLNGGPLEHWRCREPRPLSR